MLVEIPSIQNKLVDYADKFVASLVDEKMTIAFAQCEDEKAIEELTLNFTRFLYNIAYKKKNNLSGIDVDDLVMAGYNAIIIAINKYNLSIGGNCKFLSLAGKYANTAMNRTIASLCGAVRTPAHIPVEQYHSLDDINANSSFDEEVKMTPVDYYAESKLQSIYEEVFKTLNLIEIVILHYKRQGKSLEEIASYLFDSGLMAYKPSIAWVSIKLKSMKSKFRQAFYS